MNIEKMLELLTRILAYLLKYDYFIISRHFWYPTWYPKKKFYTLKYILLESTTNKSSKRLFLSLFDWLRARGINTKNPKI